MDLQEVTGSPGGLAHIPLMPEEVKCPCGNSMDHRCP